jgi:hypothetical protein
VSVLAIFESSGHFLPFSYISLRRGFHPQRPGIAAVKARLEHFGLRIVQGACPNLLAEAELYRYDADYPGPVDHTPALEYDRGSGASGL